MLMMIRMLICWSDYHLQGIQGPFGYWYELVFPSSHSTRPKRAPLQGTPRCEPPGRHFRWGLWNTGISFRLPSLQVLLSMFSRKGWRKFGQKSFPISPIDWTLTAPFAYPLLPTCTPPIKSYHLYILPNSLFYICDFFRPVVACFLPL